MVLSLEVDATEAADAVATVQPQNKEPITEPAEASLREVLLPALEAQPGTSKASPAASLDDEYVTLTMSELQDSSSATVALGLVFGYLALGVAVYSQYTGWSVLECIYFVVVTLSSVGFGDLTPQTDVMRLFTSAYILVGVGILGTALGEVVSSLLDTDGSTAGKFIRLLSGAGEKTEDDGEGAVSASLAPTLLTVAATVALGTGAISYFDASLSPVQALYYSIVTVTTVGYGDFVPQSDASRAFMTVYALFGKIPLTPTLWLSTRIGHAPGTHTPARTRTHTPSGTILLARALAAIADIPLERRRKFQQRLVLEQYGGELDANELQDLQRTLRELELCNEVPFPCYSG